MKAKANLFRTLVVLWVVVTVAVALFGVGPRTAETQTTTPQMQVQDLGTLGGDITAVSPNSTATDINNSGQVVGYGNTTIGGYTVWRAFIYDSATQTMLDLGTLGGHTSTYANGINDAGMVVGHGLDPGSHAFLYDSATQKMQDLGDLEGGNKSEAMGINDRGQVVGRSYTGSGSYLSGGGRAFLYDSTNGMQNLNDLIPADSGWTIHLASAINNEGQIAATGYKEGVGQHALLLTPTSGSPPPPDTQAPSPPNITSPQNNTYDTDGSFSVSGSAEAGSTVEVFEGAISKGTTEADSSSGAWSMAISGVSEGAHTYAAKATDAAGNTSSASNSVTVTVDATAPKVDSVFPAEGATEIGPGVDVTASFTEAMRASSINTNTVQLFRSDSTTPIADVVVSYNDGTNSATLNPDANLRRGTKYKAVVTTGTRDVAGNQLDQDQTPSNGNQQKVWFFTIRR